MAAHRIEPLGSSTIGTQDRNSPWAPPAHKIFHTAAEAEEHLNELRTALSTGDPVIVNGTTMHRQPSKADALIVGFGEGRYNTLITAESLRNGTFTLWITRLPQ